MKSLRVSYLNESAKVILVNGVRQDNSFVFAFPLSILGIIYPCIKYCNRPGSISLYILLTSFMRETS